MPDEISIRYTAKVTRSEFFYPEIMQIKTKLAYLSSGLQIVSNMERNRPYYTGCIADEKQRLIVHHKTFD